MANNTSTPQVLVLDTTADNIPAATTPIRVRKARLVAAAAAATAVITDAGGTVTKIHLSAAIGGTDTVEFYANPLSLTGLKITLTGAGAILYVYTEQA